MTDRRRDITVKPAIADIREFPGAGRRSRAQFPERLPSVRAKEVAASAGMTLGRFENARTFSDKSSKVDLKMSCEQIEAQSLTTSNLTRDKTNGGTTAMAYGLTSSNGGKNWTLTFSSSVDATNYR
jgi:hypothetical protein